MAVRIGEHFVICLSDWGRKSSSGKKEGGLPGRGGGLSLCGEQAVGQPRACDEFLSQEAKLGSNPYPLFLFYG